MIQIFGHMLILDAYYIFVQFPVLHCGLAHSGSQPFNYHLQCKKIITTQLNYCLHFYDTDTLTDMQTTKQKNPELTHPQTVNTRVPGYEVNNYLVHVHCSYQYRRIGIISTSAYF